MAGVRTCVSTLVGPTTVPAPPGRSCSLTMFPAGRKVRMCRFYLRIINSSEEGIILVIICLLSPERRRGCMQPPLPKSMVLGTETLYSSWWTSNLPHIARWCWCYPRTKWDNGYKHGTINAILADVGSWLQLCSRIPCPEL